VPRKGPPAIPSRPSRIGVAAAVCVCAPCVVPNIPLWAISTSNRRLPPREICFVAPNRRGWPCRILVHDLSTTTPSLCCPHPGARIPRQNWSLVLGACNLLIAIRYPSGYPARPSLRLRLHQFSLLPHPHPKPELTLTKMIRPPISPLPIAACALILPIVPSQGMPV
jgi:hypothetical protein